MFCLSVLGTGVASIAGFVSVAASATGKREVAERNDMVDITIIELNLEEGAISTNLPFGGSSTAGSEESEPYDERREAAGDGSSGGGKKFAILGVFVFLVIGAAVVKYLRGGDEPDVDIEAPDDGPVGVTVDTEDE